MLQRTDEEFYTMEICNSSSLDDKSVKDNLKKDDTLEDLSAQLPHDNRMNRNDGNVEDNMLVKNTAHISDSVEVRPENEFVSLNFTIVGAKELEKSDYIGKSDPYLVVTYKDKVFKSKTVNNDHNPKWNFTVILEVNMTTPENLIVEVFDEDYDKDDIIGYKSFSVQELIDCCKIEEKWIKLDNCTSGELMFSSKVTRKEVKESFVIASETIITETLRQTTPERETNQEFDKLHKKSCKMVVRRTDAEGNVVEEIYDERKGTPRKEKSVVNISSGFEIDPLSTLNESISSDSLVHDLRNEEFLTPSMTKASVAELNVLKLSDEEDLTRTVDNSMKSTVVSTNVSVGNIEFVSNDEELLEQIKGLQLSTKSKISGLMETIQETKSVETTNYVSRKIVKTIDVEGNISEEFIEESPACSQNFVQYFTSSSKPFEEIESFRSHFVESFNDMKLSQENESSKDSQLISQTSQSMKQSNQGKIDEKEFDSTPDTPIIHLSATPIHSSERSSDSNILLSEGFEEHHIETVQQTVETSSDKVDNVTRTLDKSQEQPLSSESKIKREPSFMYDTTVEAFSTTGTVVDETLDDEIEVNEFFEEQTIEGDQVMKYEYMEDTDANTEEIFVGEPLRIVTTPTQQSHVTRIEPINMSANGVDIPSSNRRLSTVSIDSSKISSTPEGEKYFMKREESFVAKVDKGEVVNLAVEISDFFTLENSRSDTNLSVKPFQCSPEKEIIVENLGSQSNLMVKPLESTIKSIPCSSYEHIYDKIEVEESQNIGNMSAAELMENLGDKFVGTHEIPESFSSFEDLYGKSVDEHYTELESHSSVTSVRWSAPVGSLEPPFLDASYLSQFDQDMEEVNLKMTEEDPERPSSPSDEN